MNESHDTGNGVTEGHDRSCPYEDAGLKTPSLR
jgi:hypothetical protein